MPDATATRECIFSCLAPCQDECTLIPDSPVAHVPAFASRYDQRLSCFLYVPSDYRPGSPVRYPVVVVVHGTERGPERYRDAFTDFAEAYGCVVLAPLFPVGLVEPGELHNYKWIEFGGIRFDHALLAMVEEAGETFPIDTDRFLLHGFSGGGQFAHRFAYLHPERLRAVSIGAPGQVTLLDPDRDWWLGVRDVEQRFGRPVDLAALRRVRVQLVIGGDDTDTWDIDLPRGSRYWQEGADIAGATRLERMASLRRSFERHGIPVRHDVVPGVAHNGFAVLDPVNAFFAEILADHR